MKKLLTCFFLIAVYASAGVADEAVKYSRVIPSAKTQNADAATSEPAVTTRAAINRTVVPNTNVADKIPDVADAVITTVSSDTVSRAAAPSRTLTLGQNQTSTVGRGTNAVPRNDSSRSAAGTSSVTSQRETLENTVNTVGRNTRTEAASINNTAAVRRAGVVLRPSTAEVGGRATIAGTDIQTGSNIGQSQARVVQTRVATTQAKETIAEATERLQQTSDLNKSCQQQYNDCMDQFCNVIDANQKRCSCSPNLSRYTKVEQSVKDANNQLNDVAQRIRYVGLSADEIRAIMSATEAELELSGSRDTTESRSMLEEIEKMIKNPTSSTSYTGDTYTGLDMDLSFSGDTSDLFSLDFLGTNTASFSNLRGTELYNSAKRRCNTVLTQCKGAGATTQQITGNYDLAIDKDCIAYEQGLTKMNDTLLNNVRSANLMLQKARLAVLQNKNQYDAKGCIAALNTCMMDDMVCGSDYYKCVDPTKRYIDENGQVVLGQRISDITSFMVNYNNAKIDEEFLEKANGIKFTFDNCKEVHNWEEVESVDEGPKLAVVSTGGDGSCVAGYLLTKIGTGQTVNNGGLCRAVLDKCQRVTYDGNAKYKPYNEVVINYVQRAMVNIYSAQKQIISDYASSCMVDIASCYNQQVSQVNAWSSTASVSSVYNVMRGACRNVALTCAYAVFYSNGTLCPTSGLGAAEACIDSISEMFYQSLLCPENSTYSKICNAATLPAGCVNNICKCDTGFEVWGKTCTRTCPSGTTRNTLTGICASS